VSVESVREKMLERMTFIRTLPTNIAGNKNKQIKVILKDFFELSLFGLQVENLGDRDLTAPLSWKKRSGELMMII